MFAIYGVKRPSNASKANSGTRADYRRQLQKREKSASKMPDRHRQPGGAPAEPQAQRQGRKLERLQKEARQLRDWPQDRKDGKGGVRRSNLTDGESAKMATGKGVIQGHTGVATVDAKHQIVMDARAHGTGPEQERLIPVIEATRTQRVPGTIIPADARYRSKADLEALAESRIDAWLPDHG